MRSGSEAPDGPMNQRVRRRRRGVRFARAFETAYRWFSGLFPLLQPFWRLLGEHRVEPPLGWVERQIKETLFDCQMCGQCVLSDTGMACPMNCPKQLRNGPCGGVRANGTCEVEPGMPCVWVQAWEGSQRMRAGARILTVQPAVDRSLVGRSAWLRQTGNADAPANP